MFAYLSFRPATNIAKDTKEGGSLIKKKKYGRSCGLFKLRILLVEDNLEISEVMTVYCGVKKDIDCKVINSGHEGLERIRNEKFDLILLDLAMPEFSGKDVIQSITKDQLVQKNIVIFTASSDPVVLEQMKGSGIKEIFKKPFSLEQLTKLIEKYRPATM
jgi:two-component system, OmpR family, response regulator